MYTIEVMIKGSSIVLSVQKKEADDAEALYKQLVDAQTMGSPTILEMTCDKDEGKKISVRTQEVVAVKLSEKAGGAGPAGAAGFFGLNANNSDAE